MRGIGFGYPRGDSVEEVLMNASHSAIGRRSFLRALGAGAAIMSVKPWATEARADAQKNDEKLKAQYRETEHVKTFYRVNRYHQN
jgi:hypothetical protein